MSKHHTRPLDKNDVFLLEQIMRDAFAESFAHFMPEQYVREWYDNDEAARSVRIGQSRCGVAEVMGRVAGFVMYMDNTITELWVDPKFQEQGVGRSLIEWVESQFRKRGFPTITMYCYENNANALLFFKQMRCRRASTHMSHDDPGGPFVVYNMLKMVKNLKR
ncbi:MAG: GNAT family N-acetyltransferase [Pseudodesulfovibrio sp.]